VRKLEQIARALAVHQFGSDESWEDQIPMARAAVEALRGFEYGSDHYSFHGAIDAILSEKPE
jgi:hypothetical protein